MSDLPPELRPFFHPDGSWNACPFGRTREEIEQRVQEYFAGAMLQGREAGQQLQGARTGATPDLPPLPVPMAHAAGDWMRGITERELALIPEGDRRDRCRAMYRIPLFTADQLRTYGDDREAEGRRKGLEEAAEVCDGFATIEGIAQKCAQAIRSLAGKVGS